MEFSKRRPELLPNSDILVCKYPLSDLAKVKYYSSDLHTGIFSYAIDIASFDGEEICSPVNGIVVERKDYSTQWIPWIESMQGKINPSVTLNWLTIQVYEPKNKGILSRNITYIPTNKLIQLCHLKAYSSEKIVDDFVKEGEIIAKVGLSGAITLDQFGNPETHLHIASFKLKSPKQLEVTESLKIKFNDSQIPDPYKSLGVK
jgi:hypothetical protein